MARTKRPPAPNWDALVDQYCTPGFIASDPIAYAHQFKDSSDPRDAECVAFLSALLSYGRRPSIRQAIEGLIAPLGNTPAQTLCEASSRQLGRWTGPWYYRFNTAQDAEYLLTRIGEIYRADQSLKTLWVSALNRSETLPQAISHFRSDFLQHPQPSYGLKFLFADPMQKSAAKRFSMLLRWLVRHDAVDLGLWQGTLSPADLVIPLDTHVAKMARHFGLTQRKSNDWHTVEEITGYFKRLNPQDPARYDFALFGLGLEGLI